MEKLLCKHGHRLSRSHSPSIFVTCSVILLACMQAHSENVDEALEQRVKLYNQAMELRSSNEDTAKDQRAFISLLQQAAFIRHATSTNPPTSENGVEWLPAPDLSGYEIANTSLPAALRELAKAYQDGYGVDINHKLSLQLFKRAADLGDPQAQGAMAMRYALGLHEVDSWSEYGIRHFGQPEDAQAVLHYYFGAMAGDAQSRAALGYRHIHGLGVPRSCWSGVAYLQPLAEEILELATSPSQLPIIEKIRLHVQASQGLKSDRHKEVLHYYQYSADHGNVDAQTAVGQVFNYGTHGIRRDHVQALKYFHKAAEAGDQEAMAHLGHMYANGFGTKDGRPDPEQAFDWLSKSAKRGQASGLYGLGYMYLVGKPFAPEGVEVDHTKAFKYLSQAVEAGSPEAHFMLGVMHLKGWGMRRKNLQKAFSYFHVASMAGHLQAMYNAAIMQLTGRGTNKACRPAAALLKQIVERGPAAAALQRAHQSFFKGQYSSALLNYLAAAEMGMELGQSNAAWMLDRGYGQEGGSAAHLAFLLHQRSAEQGNVHSLLQMGDRFYFGHGVRQDWVRAAAIYYEAYQVSMQDRAPESMFNLGFMHEFGAGVPQNLDLARKFYRMAAAAHTDAAPGMWVALSWLALHQWWVGVRSYLPPQLDFIWSKVFLLQQPHTTVFGPLGDWLSALLAQPTLLLVQFELMASRWSQLVSGWQAPFSGVQDVGETTLLVLLLALLYLVLRLRQSRQRAQRQAAAVAAATEQPPAAVPPPGNEMAAPVQ